MRQLFNIIVRYHFFFLFLLLEALSFVFIIQRGYQRSVYLSSTNAVTSSVRKGFNNISQYFGLKKTNERLARENALLHEKIMNFPSHFIFSDSSLLSLLPDSNFTVISAKVLSVSINKQKNHILIDKGRKDGVKKDMAVISPEGVAGIVVYSSERFSTIMPLIHNDIRISARIKKNRHLGNVLWDGLNYRFGLLIDIPAHVHLERGDTIISSGNSFIFPDGLFIGIVEEDLSVQGENFNKARIRFAVDFNSLAWIYVLASKNVEEELSTLNRRENE